MDTAGTPCYHEAFSGVLCSGAWQATTVRPEQRRMDTLSFAALVAAQREFFAGGATLPRAFRVSALEALLDAVTEAEQAVFETLAADLGKSAGEAYLTEVGLVRAEIRFALRHLRFWMRPLRPPTPLHALPGKSRVYREPLGLVLIIAPWNYPFQLSLIPLIGALAAGNCVILKPSSKAPATARLLDGIIGKALVPGHAAVVQGGAEAGAALLQERFDFILYTDSARVGRAVMRAAASFLTPVCLELGGKSPAIVLADADLRRAARSIAWGKTLNAGQTCIAPDYVLAARPIKAELEALLEREFVRFPGPDAPYNPDYCRLISLSALERLEKLAGPGLRASRTTLRMAPLIMPEAGEDDPVMQEEIFGPLLPVLGIDGEEEAARFVRGRDKPLACYVFTRDKKAAARLLERLSFGGGCVNDAMLHLSSPRLPFGGVGMSGMGRYHGKAGFLLFSNEKSVLHKGGLFLIRRCAIRPIPLWLWPGSAACWAEAGRNRPLRQGGNFSARLPRARRETGSFSQIPAQCGNFSLPLP